MTSASIPSKRLDAAEPFDDWPEPVPLRDELPSVVPFDAALLPTHLRGWVTDIADRMNCPPDLVAIPAMVSAGSLIGRRCLIRPQSKTLWQEAGNLWGIVVAPPGSLKTPAAAEALAPLRRLEAKAAEEHTGAMEAHKVAERLHKLQDNQVQNRVKEMLDKQGPGDVTMQASALLAAITEPEPPQSRRYMTSDATAEKLGEICAANPQGILVHRDELMSLCTDLDQPDKAAARGFMMAGWGGLDSYTFDRIQRGTIRIPAVNISLFGTTQPQRIATYVRESLRRMDDGMVQRFQLLAWPDFGSAFHEVDRHPNAQARNTAFQCYERMAGFDPVALGAIRDEFDGDDAVPYLRFSGDAQEAFAAWRFDLEASIRNEDMPATLAAHFSKYRGLLPRLALICHLTSGGSGPVTLAAFEMAKSWITYLESHARRVYASTEIDNAEAARAIWRRVKKGELPQPFTSREIQRRGWSMLKSKDRIDGGLTSLVDAYWLRKTTSATGGRPSDIYMPNPKTARL